MASGASSAPADAPLSPASASAAASAVQSSLRPRSPTLSSASEDDSAADSRRVRARVEDEQPERVPLSAAGDATVPHTSHQSPPLVSRAAQLILQASSYSKHELREIVEALQGRLTDGLAAKPPRGTPIAALAKVELQLIMRCCDRVSLIALARCSRATLAAAQNDFAWRCLSPMRICSSVPDLGHKLSSSLLRHVDVCLVLTSVVSGSPFASLSDESFSPLSDDEWATLTSMQRLRGLDLSLRSIRDKEELQRILSHPACALLTELHTGFEKVSVELLRTMAAYQPLLRTLDVNLGYIASDGLTSIAQLEHLTELRMVGVYRMLQLDPLGECRSLRTLSLRGVAGDWPALLAAPALQSLCALELLLLTHDPLPSTWAAALANLSALTGLSLTSDRIDELLVLVAPHCRSLHTLHVRMATLAEAALCSNASSLHALHMLLTQQPSLHLRLEMPAAATTPVHSQCRHWAAAHAALTPLVQGFAGRVELVLSHDQ